MMVYKEPLLASVCEFGNGNIVACNCNGMSSTIAQSVKARKTKKNAELTPDAATSAKKKVTIVHRRSVKRKKYKSKGTKTKTSTKVVSGGGKVVVKKKDTCGDGGGASPPERKKSKVVIAHDINKTASYDVYILELQEGKIYVGKSMNVTRRIEQHMGHTGAVWTKKYPPTGVTLPRLGNVRGGGDAPERDETLRYMYHYGVDRVRGWKYTAVRLSSADRKDAEANIRELFDLCRRCGQRGHFVNSCKSVKDRLGNVL
jgi:predicted GIY-YIG superfamily endonuclease